MGTASQISGWPMSRWLPMNNTSLWANKQEKRRVLERWNNTLRQRLARFVCMTLVFSGVGDHATPARLLLFLHRYKRKRAILLK